MADIKLPKDWKIKNLADVCDEIFAGGDVPKNNFSKIKTNDFSIPIYANGEKNLGLYGFTNISKVNSPALTISGRGTIGFSVVRKFPFFPIVRLLVLIPNSETDVQFLKYSIDNCNIKHTGSSIPQLTVPTVKTIKIPFPPLSTQQAIVSKIEELFSELDNGISNLKTAQQQLKTYRQSVLKWAFEGKLTNKKVKDGELPKGWKMKTLEEVCDMKAGSFIKASEIIEKFDESLFSCFGGNGLRGYTKTFTHQGEYSLIGRQGALCGNVHHVNGTFHATEHAVVVTAKEKIDIKWLYYKLTAMRLNQYSSGVAQPGLSVNKLLPIEILVPDNIEHQNIIVQEIESRLSVADKMEEGINQSLQQAEALRQSILKKAFEGN